MNSSLGVKIDSQQTITFEKNSKFSKLGVQHSEVRESVKSITRLKTFFNSAVTDISTSKIRPFVTLPSLNFLDEAS